MHKSPYNERLNNKVKNSGMYTSKLYLKIISQLPLEEKIFRNIEKQRILPEKIC